MATIKFVQLSQAKYDQMKASQVAAQQPLSNAIYFTSDTNRIYKGNKLFTSDFKVVNEVPAAETYYTVTGASDANYNTNYHATNLENQGKTIYKGQTTWTIDNPDGPDDKTLSPYLYYDSQEYGWQIIPCEQFETGPGAYYQIQGHADENPEGGQWYDGITVTKHTTALEQGRLYILSTTGDMYIYENGQVVQVGGNSATIASLNGQMQSISDSLYLHAQQLSSSSSQIKKLSDWQDELSSDVAALSSDIATLSSEMSETSASLTVTIDPNAELTSGYLKTYEIKQGTNTIGKIDIPKDLVVTSGSVVQAGDGTNGTQVITGATAGDKYIKLTIANQSEPIYIAVKDLVDVYTAQENATEVQLTVGSNNEISAAIVTGSIAKSKLDSSVQASLDKADTAYQSSDFSVFSSSLPSVIDGQIDAKINALDSQSSAASGKFMNSITIVDGKITAIGEGEYTLSSGSENGTISWNNTDVPVTGLGSAAYTNSNAYDVAGAAAQALSSANSNTSAMLSWEEIAD